MHIYLVGGAIRDKLLGMAPKEQDWLVTGAKPEDLLAQGFVSVGKSFPVFLHPETKEEYALARIETKIKPGHHGFSCQFDPNVSVEQDLKRRDLTINAIAQDKSGRFIDPYGGMDDLKQGILRHVSDAFAEDPLRVFRVARFAARFADLNFTIAKETIKLMQEIVQSGELTSLSAERVWQETLKALASNRPQTYFTVLRDVGALDYWFPELKALWGVPQSAKYHPEIDTGVHVMMALHQVTMLTTNPMVRFAVLVHDLGKGITPQAILPSHRGHETHGVPLVKAFSQRLKVPQKWESFAVLVCRYHLHFHMAFTLKPQTLLDLFTHLNAIRQPEYLDYFLLACTADTLGRKGFEQAHCPQSAYFQDALQAIRNLDVKPLLDKGLNGRKLASAIRKMRISLIAACRKKHNTNT